MSGAGTWIAQSLEPGLTKWIALPALVLLGLSTFSGVGGGNTALFLLFLSFLAVLPFHAGSMLRDPLFVATTAFLMWIAFIALEPSVGNDPEDAALVRNKAAEWARVFLLPALLVGFWLGRTPRLLPWLPLLVAVGYTVKVLVLTSPEMFAAFLSGEKRAGYDDDITHFGIYSVVALLAAGTSLGVVHRVQRRCLRRALYAVAVVCAAVALGGLIFSQTRAAWLATIVVLAICGLGAVWIARQRTGSWRPGLVALGIVVLVMAMAALLFHELLIARLLKQSDTVVRVLSGNWNDMPLDPVGYRIYAWREGIIAWLERPLFGHGPAIDLFRFRGREHPALDFLMHFHNVYINLLSTWGLVGLLLFGGVALVLGMRAWRAWQAEILPPSAAVFLAGSIIALLVFGWFDQILLADRMPFLLGILGGIAGITGTSGSGAQPRTHTTLTVSRPPDSGPKGVPEKAFQSGE
jgi:O-antigen ligase